MVSLYTGIGELYFPSEEEIKNFERIKEIGDRAGRYRMVEGLNTPQGLRSKIRIGRVINSCEEYGLSEAEVGVFKKAWMRYCNNYLEVKKELKSLGVSLKHVKYKVPVAYRINQNMPDLRDDQLCFFWSVLNSAVANSPADETTFDERMSDWLNKLNQEYSMFETVLESKTLEDKWRAYAGLLALDYMVQGTDELVQDNPGLSCGEVWSKVYDLKQEFDGVKKEEVSERQRFAEELIELSKTPHRFGRISQEGRVKRTLYYQILRPQAGETDHDLLKLLNHPDTNIATKPSHAVSLIAETPEGRLCYDSLSGKFCLEN